MLLKLDPALLNTLSESWQDWFKDFVKFLGLDFTTIMKVEYSLECGVMWFWILRLRPDTGSPYVDPKNPDEVMHDIIVFFFDKRPVRIITWEWERAMIAYQGDQGA